MQRPGIERVRVYVEESLWVVPAMIVVTSAAAAIGLVVFYRLTDFDWDLPWIFGGSADGARAVLSAIANSTLQLTATVFSITLVVLQLAASQLSPRIIQVFIRQRTTKVALGVFLGTYAYSLIALYEIRSPAENGEAFVPGIVVAGAFFMAALSIAILIRYINHIVQSIRVSTILDVITQETEREIKKRLPEGDIEDEESLEEFAGALGREYEISSPQSGTLEGVDEEELIKFAKKHTVIVRLLVPVGVHVPEGSALFSIYTQGEHPEIPFKDLVLIGPSRTIEHDFAYGFRQLVDIALRALSPSLNDPGTAVRVLDHLHELLRIIGARPLPSPLVRDEDGVLRAVIPRVTWEGYVRVALQEIIDNAGEQVEVVERLLWLVTELETAVTPYRRRLLRRVRAEVEALPAASRQHRDWNALPEHGMGRPGS